MTGSAISRCWQRLLPLLAMMLLLIAAPNAWAGPVDWQEVETSTQGRQWWDAGSLRLTREGRVSVLSRFQPVAASDDGPDSQAENRNARPGDAQLYVMELDCAQELYRDTSINGLPRFRTEWQVAAGDELTLRVVRAACTAALPLLEPDQHG